MSLSNNRLINYIKDSKVELQKVVWPTKQEVYKHTWIVIGVSLAAAAFLGIFDYIFSKILERFI
ncbi:MAG: preprotein translocase subunit SecE [Patescibacteria group bacterium]